MFTLLLLSLLASAEVHSAPQAHELTSVSGNHRLTLVSRAHPVPINQWHEWDLRVHRADGRPLRVQAVAVDGGMPEHGHGLPTAPSVQPGEAPGHFVITGLRFNMKGRWQLRVLLVTERGPDSATLPLDLGVVRQDAGVPTWSESELETLRSLRLGGAPPADPTNAVADDPRAVALGHRLFFDARLSGDHQTSCATCHRPGDQFAGGRMRRRAPSNALERDVPSLTGVAYARWFFWDGRRDSLWSQALVPLEAAEEMNTTRLEVVRHVATQPTYQEAYRALFGALPALAGLPRRASPVGDDEARASWAALGPAQQDAVNRAFGNIGKAIAAYERRLLPKPSAFDRYVDAVLAKDEKAAGKLLSPRAVAGLRLFVSEGAQCLRCHNGPMFSNGGFHSIGTGGGRGVVADFGRSIGVQAVLATEFNCLGPYSDDKERRCPELTHLNRHDENAELVGAFKVPSLRTAAATAPYMHDGRYRTLVEVMSHYRDPPAGGGPPEFRPLFDFAPAHMDALAAFVSSLASPIDAPPALLRRPR